MLLELIQKAAELGTDELEIDSKEGQERVCAMRGRIAAREADEEHGQGHDVDRPARIAEPPARRAGRPRSARASRRRRRRPEEPDVRVGRPP